MPRRNLLQQLLDSDKIRVVLQTHRQTRPHEAVQSGAADHYVTLHAANRRIDGRIGVLARGAGWWEGREFGLFDGEDEDELFVPKHHEVALRKLPIVSVVP